MSTNDAHTDGAVSTAGPGPADEVLGHGLTGVLTTAFAELAGAVRELADAVKSSAVMVPIEYDIVPCDGEITGEGDGGDEQAAEVRADEPKGPRVPCPCAEKRDDVGLTSRESLPLAPVPSPAQTGVDAGDEPCGRHRRPDDAPAPAPVAVS